MRKSVLSLLLALTVTALSAIPAFANLGLQATLVSQGAPAVGQAVLTAAKAVYAANTDPAVIQSQLIAILNEAAATGNEQAIRYAIVAVMLAGGVENLSLSKTAINNSNVFLNYETLTAVTVAAVEALMTASGGAGGQAGGGETGGGGDGTLGGGDNTLGGGSDKLFLMEIDLNNLFPPSNSSDTIPPEKEATPD